MEKYLDYRYLGILECAGKNFSDTLFLWGRTAGWTKILSICRYFGDLGDNFYVCPLSRGKSRFQSSHMRGKAEKWGNMEDVLLFPFFWISKNGKVF